MQPPVSHTFITGYGEFLSVFEKITENFVWLWFKLRTVPDKNI